MDKLPDEIILQIFQHLEPRDLASTQTVSPRFLLLTRDDELWKAKCFEDSFAERRRRRGLLGAPNGDRNAALLRALAELIPPNEVPLSPNDNGAPSARSKSQRNARREQARALANWDPSYPDERINFYEEYIQRHAPVCNTWFESIHEGVGEGKQRREATGAALLYNDAEQAEKLYAPLDDGSIGVWDVSTNIRHANRGRIVGRSKAGLLAGCKAPRNSSELENCKNIMTSTGAVDCVSIDGQTMKGYFAIQDRLVQVDLETLQAVSSERFPHAIHALSEAKHPTPITVGTNMTIHLHDPRAPSQALQSEGNTRLELIGGSTPRAGIHSFRQLLAGPTSPRHVYLSQPGPSSIVHLPDDREWDGNGSIWVAGRFTSLLNYDRRFFPRLRGTVHSGARISCLRLQPHPFIPREWDFARRNAISPAVLHEAKSQPGHTLLVAGEYKGKGSLELYGLSPHPAYTTLSTDASARGRNAFQNRQTAAGTKLLSVAAHGGKTVYSDGDGNVRWVERDGFTPVRSWNLDAQAPTTDRLAAGDFSALGAGAASSSSSSSSPPAEDIVQLLLPTMPRSTTGHASIGEDNLVIWTGEGKLGLIGFGHREKWAHAEMEEEALDYEELARRREEREYAGLMGRALRRQQDELNFMRSFGMG